MAAALEPDHHDTAGMERRLTQRLAALGAETRAQRQVKRILPWVLSLAIHASLALLALFITWTVANLPSKDEAVLIVADFNAMTYEPVASPHNLQTQGAAAAPVVRDLAPPTPPAAAVMDRLAQGAADPARLLLGSAGIGGGESGTGGLGRLGPPSQGGGGTVTFAGLGGANARKVVYAIDASGSMIAYLQVVIDELERSLANLAPPQSFAVVFFQGRNAIEPPHAAGTLIPATPAEKERVLKWIRASVVPKEGTDPRVAIKKALTLKPDVIFLLSQDITGYGQFEVDQRDLMRELDELNPIDPATHRRRTQINCIQFLDPDPLDTMQAIAREHGGPNGYKLLSRKELGLGGP